MSQIVPGSDVFKESIATAPADKQEELQRLLNWADDLEAQKLAQLQTSIGKERWVLKPRLPGQTVGLVTIWNENGPYLSPNRTVLHRHAPQTLTQLDKLLPDQIRHGNYIKSAVTDEMLELFRQAYVEAVAGDGPAKDPAVVDTA